MAELTALGRVLSLPDPLLGFKWVCTFLPFERDPVYVESIDLPFLNIDIGDKTHVASSYFYYPGTHNINSFSIVFYEDQMASSLKYLMMWKSKVKDLKTGLYNLPGADGSGYKQTIKVQLQDTGNNPIVDVSLLGVWPADTGNLALNYTDGNRLTLSQTFSIDDQDIVFLK